MPETVAARLWDSTTPAPRPAAVASVGVALPPGVASNAATASRLGVSEEWIVERTGVRERRVSERSEDVVDLAAEASAVAVEKAGIDAADLDLVLAATMSYDRLTPNLGPAVAARIGAERAGALDVGAACSGFIGALALATAQVESGRAGAVVVVGAEQMSRLIDPLDRSTAALFGDGAGAVTVVEGGNTAGSIGPIVLGQDGARGELVRAEREEAILRMEGQDTFREAVRRLSKATIEVLALSELEPDGIDAFIFHQANARILAAVGQRLGINEQRVVNTISRFGNTSAASVPIALADSLQSGLLRPGGRALLAAFGGGLTWGAATIEWGAADVD